MKCQTVDRGETGAGGCFWQRTAPLRHGDPRITGVRMCFPNAAQLYFAIGKVTACLDCKILLVSVLL